MKACPFCAEEIQEAAVKCKHCGSMLGPMPYPPGPSYPPGPLPAQHPPGTPAALHLQHPGALPYQPMAPGDVPPFGPQAMPPAQRATVHVRTTSGGAGWKALGFLGCTVGVILCAAGGGSVVAGAILLIVGFFVFVIGRMHD